MSENSQDPIIPLSMVMDSIKVLREDMKDRLESTEERLKEGLESTEERLQDRFDTVEARLDRVEEQTGATNGRVRKVEIWQARWDGTKAAFHWLPPLLAGLAGAAVAAGTTELVTQLVH